MEESDARAEGEEMITSRHQAHLLFYPPLLTTVRTGLGSRSPFVHAGPPFVSAGSSFPSTGTGSPFVFTHSGSPFASTGTGPQALVDTTGLYELGYRHAPLPLPSLSTGSSGSVTPFGVIPTPLARNRKNLRHHFIANICRRWERTEHDGPPPLPLSCMRNNGRGGVGVGVG